MPTLSLPIEPIIEGNLDLTQDQEAVLLRELKEQISAFGFIAEMLVKKKPVPKQMAHSILYLSESRTAQMCKLTGIELDSLQERDDRYARVRSLNEQVRELQEELGKTGTVEQTTNHIKTIYKNLDAWWEQEGFGHISDFSISQSGMLEVKFSCHLFGKFALTQSKTPVSDVENKKQWHESLRDRGFELLFLRGESEPVLFDNDTNRLALTNLFSNVFPSADIFETTNHYNSRERCMVMTGLRVFFRDLQEIINLEIQ